MSIYKIKDWENYQHYKDRHPPWIKLHKSLLYNFDFHSMPMASRALLMFMWLMASESQDHQAGVIDADFKKLAFRMQISVREIQESIKPLIENGYIIDASNSLAQCYQNAIPEQSRAETEQSTESKFFSVFWASFPRQRRGNKQKAFRAYNRAVKRTTPERIQKAVEIYAKSEAVLKGFAKGAEAWLNDDRWDDVPVNTQSQKSFRERNAMPSPAGG